MPEKEENPMKIMATKINIPNAIDHDQFTSSTEFHIEKSEIYFRVIQGLYATH